MSRSPGSRWFALGLMAAVAATTGCQGIGKFKDKAYHALRSTLNSSYNDPEAEAKMARAEAMFEQKQFQEAQPVFRDVADNQKNPHLLAEKARYLEAECLRERRHYPDAVGAYHRLLQDFPAGAYRERAAGRMYEIAYHEWLETETLADIEAEMAGKKKSWWQSVKMPNPLDPTRPTFDTEGLALKTLENAHTHDIMGPNADKALFWSGYIHFYRGRYEDADHYFSQLVEMHKESKLRPLALEMAIYAKNLSTGGSVYDSTKASEALQLVHHAEASDPTYTQDPKKAEWLTKQKLSVRMQLGDKDMKMAEYYERTGHPAAAYFCYELVCRRYPGTKMSDVAKTRLAALEQVRDQIDNDRATGRHEGTSGAITRQWDRLIGRPVDPLGAELLPDPKKVAPTAPAPAPQTLPPDISNPR